MELLSVSSIKTTNTVKMFLLIVVIALASLYFLYVTPRRYWKNKNVPSKESLPIFGHIAGTVLRADNLVLLVEKMYNQFSDSRYFGLFSFFEPILIIKDPALLKRIMVKDFDVFPVHASLTDEEVDPLWSKNLFFVQGFDKWRHMRATLSPSFTGNKMRMMFKLIDECAQNFVNYYKQGNGIVKLDIKESLRRYANDVIASTAFGISIDSLKNKNNEFFIMGKDVADFDGTRAIKFFMYTVSPALMKLLKITVISGKVSRFFKTTVKDNIRLREEQNIVRPDMIHLPLEARKGKNNFDVNDPGVDNGFAVVEESEIVKREAIKDRAITDDITAQAMIFFLAGFDTSSTLMGFTAMELAAHPDIQERLAQEVGDLKKRCEGKPTYEDIVHLKYLDMVISEALRKWPPPMITNRKCVKPYIIEPEREWELPVKLDVNTAVWIPIYSIHRDPKHYPDPEKFDPERFSDENKGNIQPFTYLPFGLGPRNCIGSRFALLETKIILYHILNNFEIVATEETPLPLKLNKKNISPGPEGGYNVGLKKRTN